MIYLDYAATTPVDPLVLDSFCLAERHYMGNPNARHKVGCEAKEELDRITASIAELLDVSAEEVIYTSGASESNNTAIKGLVRAYRHVGRHIISTPLEHSSVSGCLTALQEQGYEIDLVDIRRDGTIDTEHFQYLLRPDTVLAALCAVDGEIGTIQPIEEIAALIRQGTNCRLHVDATQAVGKTKLCTPWADTMSLAPHKFYGLKGSGLLIKRKGVSLEPLIYGGASTTIYRSGTPALALAAGMETALRLALHQQETRCASVQEKNRVLRSALGAYPKVRIHSPEGAVPHILNLSVQGVKAVAFQQALDEEGVCVSVKSACSVEGTPSRAVFAVSRDRKAALSSWRISLSHLTTEEEVQGFLTAFDRCYRVLCG